MRRCPESGTNCFDPGCATGCQGYDIHIEAITVIHTTIRRRASMSLVYGASNSSGPATHDSGRACEGTAACECLACKDGRRMIATLWAPQA